MRGVYSAPYKISGLNSARTLWYITVPSNKTVVLQSASVKNASVETNEQLEIAIQKVSSLGSPTATTLTPSKHEQGDQAAGSTVKANVTGSEPTYGANTELAYQGDASLNGWVFQPIPEEQPILAGGDTWGIRILAAPAAFDAIINVTFREQG